MKYTTVLIILFIQLISCVTLKTKKSMVSKQIEVYTNKYGNNGYLELSIFSNLINGKNHNLKNMSTRKIKMTLKKIERAAAMKPDSINVSNQVIDSFYLNKSKVDYIKRNKLMSSRVHFIE